MARQRCPMIDQGLRTGGAAAQTKDAFLGGAAAQTKDAFLGGAAAQTHFLGSWRETRIQEVRSQESGDSRELLSAQEQPERLPFIDPARRPAPFGAVAALQSMSLRSIHHSKFTIHHSAAQPPLCASAPLRETAFHLAFGGAAARQAPDFMPAAPPFPPRIPGNFASGFEQDPCTVQ